MRRRVEAHTATLRSAVLALVVALAVCAAPATALAAACPRTSLAEIENEVMCPVCKTPLGLAQEAPQADRQRAFILERVERCQSKRQIKAALAAEFGDEVLAMPEREGFDIAVYIVPIVALLLALGGGAAAAVRWRRRRPRPATATALVASAAAGSTAADTVAGAGPDAAHSPAQAEAIGESDTGAARTPSQPGAIADGDFGCARSEPPSDGEADPAAARLERELERYDG
jgi:cytochrome c-type biogenesis protein CcmH